MADRHLIDVHVLLVRDRQLLLTQRRGTDEFASRWHAPSGKLDAGEAVTAAAAREAFEEVGVVIDPESLRHVHTLHVAGSGPEPRLGLFFAADSWLGEPVNKEPAKCAAVQWFPLNELPESSIIEYPLAGIRGFLDGVMFGEMGWREAAVTAG
jgi:8-oxo-dGTP pyrophosphatase MutT (NUDIX family)